MDVARCVVRAGSGSATRRTTGRSGSFRLTGSTRIATERERGATEPALTADPDLCWTDDRVDLLAVLRWGRR